MVEHHDPDATPAPAQALLVRPAASVVVCTYTGKRWSQLLAAIESLRRQTISPAEIIIVVDHNPALLARVQQEIPAVVAIPNREQRGLSGGKNTGLIAARHEIVAFLDDDAVAESTWLEHLLAPYSFPDVVAVGGRTISVWETGRPRWFPPEFEWVVGGSYRGLPLVTSAVRNLHGGNMSMRRDVLLEIGGFRTLMGRVGTRPVGCEETELCIRVRQRWPHFDFIYSPVATIHHHVPRERGWWRYYASRCYAEGISKKQVTHSVGVRDGLSTERGYALRTLPRGVITNLKDLVFRREPGGLARAAAIVVGLTVTAAGYSAGTLSSWRPARPARAPVPGSSVDGTAV